MRRAVSARLLSFVMLILMGPAWAPPASAQRSKYQFGSVGPYLNAGIPSIVSLQLGAQFQWCTRCPAGFALTAQAGVGGLGGAFLLTFGARGEKGISHNIFGIGPSYFYTWGYPVVLAKNHRQHVGGEITYTLLDFKGKQGSEFVKFSVGYLTTVDGLEQGHMILASVGVSMPFLGRLGKTKAFAPSH